ncbi:MAG TPA: IS1634 family transposase [Myxococcota bacterium]|nr:IS1634 family transposase [Myxococcota bacterium]
MYVRATPRRNKNGSVVRYLQLAHNTWDPVAKRSRAEVIYNFGREDAQSRAALERLAGSLSRFLEPDAAVAAGGEGFDFLDSRPLGGSYALDGLWRRLGIDALMRRLLRGRRRDAAAERVLFALVANRALAPSSKLAAARWVSEDVHIAGLPQTTDDACYRAMDWLLEIQGALEREVFHQVASLLNLEVDLLFFDTTSTYFCCDEADEPVARNERGALLAADDEGEREAAQRAGFRTYGKSKDHRDDLPQVVIGMAVTREGIPVRVWSWPGNTADSALIRQVKDDLRDWTLSRIVWVADRGFASTENRRFLRRGDEHYILGEKLRSGSAEAKAALARAGRYQEVAAGLRVKEVRISEGERFVVCESPEGAGRDAAVRARLLARLKEMIAASDKLSPTKRAELRGVISTKPGLARYLRTTAGGLLRIDEAAIKAEERLDGKYLLRCSDPTLSAADIALGYKQLAEVERGWRDMKQVIDLRPVYHRKEERIRAHVVLCWLALLLIRVTETSCGDSWPNMRRELEKIKVGSFQGAAGSFRQRTEISASQRAILAKLELAEPPRLQELTPAAS